MTFMNFEKRLMRLENILDSSRNDELQRFISQLPDEELDRLIDEQMEGMSEGDIKEVEKELGFEIRARLPIKKGE